jgi:hypothetical protein
MKRIQILYRGAIGAFVASIALVASPTSLAQVVSVNGTSVTCQTGTTSMTVGTTGNITITCTPSGGGSPATFSCNAAANPNPILANGTQTSTISVNCVNGTGTSTYAWTAPSNPPTPTTAIPALSSAQTYQVGPFTAAGNFTFNVLGTSGDATPASSSSGVTLVVNSTSTGGGGTTTCPASKTMLSTGNQTFVTDTPQIAKLTTVSYTLPMYNSTNAPQQRITSALSVPLPIQLNFTGINNNADGGTSPRWGVQFAVSQTPCDFTNTPSFCTAVGIPDNGGIVLRAFPATTIPSTGNNCTMAFGTQYYLNVRFIASDKTTPSCLNAFCSMILNFNSNAVFP